jgi:hypothetical protein
MLKSASLSKFIYEIKDSIAQKTANGIGQHVHHFQMAPRDRDLNYLNEYAIAYAYEQGQGNGMFPQIGKCILFGKAHNHQQDQYAEDHEMNHLIGADQIFPQISIRKGTAW